MLGIVDGACTRQLLGLLPVLTSALPVALARDRSVTAARIAYLARRENNIYVREDVIDAIRMMLDAAGVHDHARLGPTVKQAGLYDLFRRNAGEL